MREIKVDNGMHANYLDKEKRLKELNYFAEKVAYAELSESDRTRYYDAIEQSLKNLGIYNPNSENGLKKNDWISQNTLIAAMLISGGVCFGLGWKANDVYRETMQEIRKKDVEEIADYVKERLKLSEG